MLEAGRQLGRAQKLLAQQDLLLLPLAVRVLCQPPQPLGDLSQGPCAGRRGRGGGHITRPRFGWRLTRGEALTLPLLRKQLDLLPVEVARQRRVWAQVPEA